MITTCCYCREDFKHLNVVVIFPVSTSPGSGFGSRRIKSPNGSCGSFSVICTTRLSTAKTCITADLSVQNAHFKHNQSKQSQGLDVDLLCLKLEAAKREQDAARSRQRRREAAKQYAHVPRNAASQLLSTTAPPIHGEVSVRRIRSDDKSMRHCFADGKPSVNPKRLYAALNMGMSESEVMALADEFVQISISEGVEHVVDRTPRQQVSAWNNEGVKSRRTDMQEKYAPIAGREDLIVEHIEEVVEQQGPMRTYKPGDAAKRRSQIQAKNDPNAGRKDAVVVHVEEVVEEATPIRTYHPGDAAKRRSQLRDKKLLPVNHSSLTRHSMTRHSMTRHSMNDLQHPAATCNDTPAFRHSLHNEYTVSFDLNCLVEDAEFQSRNFLQQPRFNPHDRPHWAQSSECGDEFRHLLNLPLVQKKDKAHAVHEEAKKVLEGGVATNRRPVQQRQKSLGDLPENLVSEAVARIKKQERARMRQSIVGFLKR